MKILYSLLLFLIFIMHISFAVNVQCWFKQPGVDDPPMEASNYINLTVPIDGTWGPPLLEYFQKYNKAVYILKNNNVSYLDQECVKILHARHISTQYYFIKASTTFASTDIWSNINNKPSKRIIVFGDSFSDTGNLYHFTQNRIPNNKTWYGGHFTNGLVWTEYLSQEMNVPLITYAFGGASTTKAQFAGFVIPGVTQQVNMFVNQMKALKKQFGKDTDLSQSVAIFLTGSNDITANPNAPTAPIADAVEEGLIKLYAIGIRRFIVVELPNLSYQPQPRSPEQKALLSKTITNFNYQLNDRVNSFRALHDNVKLLELDGNYFLKTVIANPKEYGFTNTTDACLDLTKNKNETYYQISYISFSCTDPDAYVFWDNAHPSTAFHEEFSKYILPYIPANWKNF